MAMLRTSNSGFHPNQGIQLIFHFQLAYPFSARQPVGDRSERTLLIRWPTARDGPLPASLRPWLYSASGFQVAHALLRKGKAASGFEPLNRDFADPSLNHLGTPPNQPKLLTRTHYPSKVARVGLSIHVRGEKPGITGTFAKKSKKRCS